MRLPEPIERLLEPGPARLPDPGWDEWVSLGYGYTTAGSPVIELKYDRELPPWNSGPYRQDVPKAVGR
jgi:hypothetical protein